MLVRAHAHYGYCGAEEVYEEEFENSATDEEIEEYFNEWIEDHYRAHWEPVSDQVDAYENWF